MMRTSLVFVSLLSLLPSLAEAAPAFVGQISASKCVSNLDPWKEDRCQPLWDRGGNCLVTIQPASRRRAQVSVSWNGFRATGMADSLYEIARDQIGAFQQSKVNGFGRLITGSLMMNLDPKSQPSSPRRLDVFVNDDSSGSTYVRYRCEGLRPANP